MRCKALNDDTKILTETDTETFFPIPNFPKPKPRLFSRDQILRNRDFFSETKFSKTKTENFFRDQILRNRNRNPQKLAKVLKPRSFETEMSISGSSMGKAMDMAVR